MLGASANVIIVPSKESLCPYSTSKCCQRTFSRIRTPPVRCNRIASGTHRNRACSYRSSCRRQVWTRISLVRMALCNSQPRRSDSGLRCNSFQWSQLLHAQYKSHCYKCDRWSRRHHYRMLGRKNNYYRLDVRIHHMGQKYM